MVDQGLRVGAYGVIVQDEQVLLVEMKSPDKEYFHFPGGGLEQNESIYGALHREVLEETGLSVNIHRLLLVWEYVPQGPSPKHGNGHELELYFHCTLKKAAPALEPEQPDTHQIALRWVDVGEVAKLNLAPNIGSSIIEQLENPSPNPFQLDVG